MTYATETRTREVAIRKVFGATQASLTFLLSKDFVKLMLWSAGFAIPVCFTLFDDILSTMQHYRVSINVGDILTGLVIFFVFGIAAIASQTHKSARANPIDTLRYE